MDVAAQWPEWALWRGDAEPPLSVGVEEEVMLLDPADGWCLAQRGDEVLAALANTLEGRVCAELHRATLELQTRPHRRVADAVDELRELRHSLARTADGLGLRVATAGSHPFHDLDTTEVSSGERYQVLRGLLRGLAQREPTFALHVHVAAPDAEAGMRLYGALRQHLPLLIALAGSSPFWRGRDSGFASSRTFLFQAFPRTGVPRRYASYREWVEAVDVLIRCGAIDDPTYLWWDVRPQAKLGTIEVRVMDAQSRLADTGALVALVQSLARAALEGSSAAVAVPDEVLHENRFLAARDGVTGRLVDPAAGSLQPVLDAAAAVLAMAEPHAEALGCGSELAGVRPLLHAPGATRQRAVVAEADGDLTGLVARLANDFLN